MDGAAAPGAGDGQQAEPVWADKPLFFVNDYTIKVLGRPAIMAVSQLSEIPPLFECRLAVDDGRKTLGVGVASKRKDAEQAAAVQLCRVIEELTGDEIVLFKTLAVTALAQVPIGMLQTTWISNPPAHVLKKMQKKQLRQVSVETRNYGSRFIAQVDCDGVHGVGLGPNKKKAESLAWVDVCARLEAEEATASADSASRGGHKESISLDPGIFLYCELAEYQKESWYAKPREELYSWAIKVHGKAPIYRQYQKHGEKSGFFTTVSVPDAGETVGCGRALAIGEALRFAAISYLAKCKSDQPQDPTVNTTEAASPAPITIKYTTKARVFPPAVESGAATGESTPSWYNSPEEEVCRIASQDSTKCFEYHTRITLDGYYETFLRLSSSERVGRGFAADYATSRRLASVDFCQSYYSPDAGVDGQKKQHPGIPFGSIALASPAAQTKASPKPASSTSSANSASSLLAKVLIEANNEKAAKCSTKKALSPIQNPCSVKKAKIHKAETGETEVKKAEVQKIDVRKDKVQKAETEKAETEKAETEKAETEKTEVQKDRVQKAQPPLNTVHTLAKGQNGAKQTVLLEAWAFDKKCEVLVNYIVKKMLVARPLIEYKGIQSAKVNGWAASTSWVLPDGDEIKATSGTHNRKANASKDLLRIFTQLLKDKKTSMESHLWQHGLSLKAAKLAPFSLQNRPTAAVCTPLITCSSSSCSSSFSFSSSHLPLPPPSAKPAPIPSDQPKPVPSLDTPVLSIEIPRSRLSPVVSWLQDEQNVQRLSLLVDSLVREREESAETLALDHDTDSTLNKTVSLHLIQDHSDQILRDFSRWRASPEGKAAELFKSPLPAYRYGPRIVEALQKSQVVVVAGGAGCGKSTQIPSLILDQMTVEGYAAQCNLIVTEPRRIAVVSLARRVAQERGEETGRRIGYQVRFDNRSPSTFGSVTYCTTGVLLNKLRFNPNLYGYSHVVIDEVHERDLMTDVSLAVLRELLLARPELRLIIMSATMDVALFERYFGQFTPSTVSIEVPPNRAQQYYLDDMLPLLDSRLLSAQDAKAFVSSELPAMKESDPTQEMVLNIPYSLLEAILGHVCSSTSSEEAILVFLPGWEEMATFQRCLLSEDLLNVGYSNPRRFCIHLVHSQMRASDQAVIFEIPPTGVRKIILATSMAESSITIDDVVHVIDCAKTRGSFYESEADLKDLNCHWISRANCIQRCSRAGRTRSHGSYYCVMSKARYANLEPIPIPEIVRVDLEELCLLIKSLGLPGSIHSTLSKVIDCASVASINKAIQRLQTMQALTSAEELTPLGRLLSKLPLSPSVGTMVLYGLLMRCLDPILIVASSISIGGPFTCTRKAQRPPVPQQSPETCNHHRAYGTVSGDSDHLSVVMAFNDWRTGRAQFEQHDEVQYAREHGVSLAALVWINQLRHQLLDVLEDSGMLCAYGRIFTRMGEQSPSKEALSSLLNENSRKPGVLRAVILAGLRPNLAVGQKAGPRMMQTRCGDKVHVHPQSLVRMPATTRSGPDALGEGGGCVVYAFQNKIHGPRPFVETLTRCSPIALLLFASQPLSEYVVRDAQRGDLARAILRLPRCRVHSWIGFAPGAETDEMQLVKVASELCIAELFSRLAAGSVSGARAERQDARPGEEIVRYLDRVLGTVAALLEMEGPDGAS